MRVFAVSALACAARLGRFFFGFGLRESSVSARKSSENGHGGKRPGAGRKPKVLIKVAKTPEMIEAAETRIKRMAALTNGPASALLFQAFAALQDVINNSQADAPRVSAAKAIIELANSERGGSPVLFTPIGKKAQALAAAAEVTTAPTDDWGDDLVDYGRTN